MAKFDPGAGEAGVLLHGAGKQPDSLLDIGSIDLFEFLRAKQIKFIGIQIFRSLSVGGNAACLLNQT
ncbi:hypothetical protein D9M72_622130 [compost metagenome]